MGFFFCINFDGLKYCVTTRSYCRTENCIQYPVINHNGKEYEKECVYMCVCVSVTAYSSNEHSIINQLYFSKKKL